MNHSDAIPTIDAVRSDRTTLHPAWVAFIRHCREMGYGEISNLKVQDGLPVMAEESIGKVKFV
ncbi:MAG: hypothetical protein EX260_10080 [Desulfobulbaceae bacterium]|nr:MAG: hypothetical protein EX260_10080 [Desulfobulbaceae bacterium]